MEKKYTTKDNNYRIIEAHEALHQAVGEVFGKYRDVMSVDYCMTIQKYCNGVIRAIKAEIADKEGTPYETVSYFAVKAAADSRKNRHTEATVKDSLTTKATA